MENVKDKREKAAYVTAIVAFIAGWGMTIAGFIVPPTGEISDSVLWVLGQALIYAASVFGVTMYFRNQMEQFRTETRKFIHQEIEEDNGQE